MKRALRAVTLLAGLAATAAGAFAQGAAVPVGHWQSPANHTFANPLHPALTGGEMFLKIDVSADGSFRGEWGEYSCAPTLGAYGVLAATCGLTGRTERASGRFGPAREGTIDLGRRGRSTFTWSIPAADELALDLPKNWLGPEAILYRARMTRDGKPKPSPAPADEPWLSAVALYREFKQDERSALARHAGKRLELEGRRGTLIEFSDGGAAVHIPDGFTSRALVLSFSDRRQVAGISEGARFRFVCTIEGFYYQYVHLRDCVTVR